MHHDLHVYPTKLCYVLPPIGDPPPSRSYTDKAAQTSSKTPAPVTSSHSMSCQARQLFTGTAATW
jgi:hypothetical protein